MGQIVKGKKKGRPSKADLERRADMLPSSVGQTSEDNDRRRSLRRRNVRYNNFIDYDDYVDEFEDLFEEEGGEPQDEEEEEDEARRKEKKLKLVLNLHEQNQGRVGSRTNRKRGRTTRVFHTRVSEPRGRIVSEEEDEEDDEEEEQHGERDGKLFPNKRGMYISEEEVLPGRNEDDEEEYGVSNGNEEEDDDQDDIEQSGRKRDHARENESTPGTPSDSVKQMPLPDKKSLELILDKLQKKDIYGVYAEPVDLEELPDYLDVIDHPMDFATVRKKLTNGSYACMDQFESDVFLICSNAMQYNSSDTIYYKQARTIKELATKKFQKLRMKVERTEAADKDVKSEQKTKSNLLLRKQGKKALNRHLQESVGSDFSSGATLATQTENQNGSAPFNGYEKHTIVDMHGENSSMFDNLTEKAEELSAGKGSISRFGRKPSVLEDRRSTYNMPHHSATISESVLATFDSEIKQLVAVGLHADHAYSRSLARFAATLGPVAWKVASPKIEHVLPSGYKYGRGWVGEYEPLPTPILIPEAQKQSESSYFPNLPCGSGPLQEHPKWKPLVSNGKSSSSLTPLQKLPPKNVRETPNKKAFLPNATRSAGEMKNSAFSSPSNLPHNPSGRNLVELNLPPPGAYNDDSAERQRISKSRDVSGSTNHMNNSDSRKPDIGVLHNGVVSLSGKLSGSDHGLTDPVEAMRISTQKSQNHHSSSKLPIPDSSSGLLSGRSDSSSAAATAARAWMSIGAGNHQISEQNSTPKCQFSVESLYNPVRNQLRPQIGMQQSHFSVPAGYQIPDSNGLPFQSFLPGSGNHFQSRPMMFPHLTSSDLARLQMQLPWRGLSPLTHQKQKPDTLPPDLNIGFQSPGSPVKQSSTVISDSQQPDLALQL